MVNGGWHAPNASTRRTNLPATTARVKQILPTRNGVGPSCVTLPQDPDGRWRNVLDYLVTRFGTLSRAEIEARLGQGEITDANGLPVSPTAPYVGNRKLFYYRSIADEPRIPFDEVILFEDDFLIAVDKPHFLPMAPSGRFLQETLLVRLKRKLGLDDIAPMHRIDRETAGVVLFTKQPATRGAYQTLFQHRLVDKQYQAIAPWRADLVFPMTCRSRIVESDHFMRMCEEPGEPNAHTEIQVETHNNHFARYRLTPITGRKHQLRIQMASLGMPIVNDQIYPRHVFDGDGDMSKPLQLLAQSIAFIDPISGVPRRFESQRTLAMLPEAISGPANQEVSA